MAGSDSAQGGAQAAGFEIIVLQAVKTVEAVFILLAGLAEEVGDGVINVVFLSFVICGHS